MVEMKQMGLLKVEGAQEGSLMQSAVTVEEPRGIGQEVDLKKPLGSEGGENEPGAATPEAIEKPAKLPTSEYERRKQELLERQDLPRHDFLDWDRDIWEMDLPERETMALVTLRKQMMGMPVEDAVEWTESRFLESTAMRIGRGEISSPGELVTEISHQKMTLDDRKALLEILQMKGPKDKPLAPMAMRLFSYLPDAESADLRCYQEALADIWEEAQEEEPDEKGKKKKVTAKEICVRSLERVKKQKNLRHFDRAVSAFDRLLEGFGGMR
jgi:hypothetical protein